MNNLANILTILRLLLLPFIIIFMFLPFEWAAWLSLILYIIGAVTDWLDGWVARKFNQITPFGRFLDPIADKVFVVTVLLMLVAVDRISGLMVLAVIVILVREFMVSGLREFLGPKNITVHVTPLAKWKTAVQMVATGCLIIGGTNALVDMIGEIGLCFAAAMTALTGWQYIKAGMKHIND
jgi:CDP-diacylglycerol--glycerol-3-phosphate 3-phosphatidyltransferase